MQDICKENGIDYTKLTVDNFYMKSFANAKNYPAGPGQITEYAQYGGILELTKTYDATNGDFAIKIFAQMQSIYNSKVVVSATIADIGADCYLIA